MSALLAMIGALVIATEPVQATERTVDRDASWRMLLRGLLRRLCGSFHTASATTGHSRRTASMRTPMSSFRITVEFESGIRSRLRAGLI